MFENLNSWIQLLIMKKYSFESLEAWKDSRKLVQWIYQLTESFPKEERFGLISQVRRASVSVVSNLAEGSSRKSSKDQANFSQMAYSSLIEVLNHLILAVDLGFMIENKMSEARNIIEPLTLKIGGLRNYQLSRISKP